MNEPTLDHPRVTFKYRNITVTLKMLSSTVYLAGTNEEKFYHPLDVVQFKGELFETLKNLNYTPNVHMFDGDFFGHSRIKTKAVSKTGFLNLFNVYDFDETYKEYLERTIELVKEHIDDCIKRFEAHKQYFEEQLNG